MASQPTLSQNDGNSGTAYNSWKSKLTEDQLKRKRLQDRQSRRETRSKVKDTVATLEERLRLMATPDRLIMSLIESNAEFQAQRDCLQGILDTCMGAFGFDKAEGRDILTRQMQRQKQPKDEATGRAAMVSALPSPSASSPDSMHWQRSPADVEIDSRMRIHITPSPFFGIGRVMQLESQNMTISDQEILAAIPKWRDSFESKSSSHPNSVMGLACELIHSDLPPSQIRDQETLERLVRLPDFFYLMIAELLGLSVEEVRPPGATTRHCLLDVIGSKRRQMIALAVESTRAWRYNSPAERVLMFWGVYRTLCLLVFPTPQNLARCPPWYRPVPSQFVHPHPSWVDFIPWPFMRDRMIHIYRDYRDADLLSTMLASLKLNPKWNANLTSLLGPNDDHTDLILDPEFQAEIDSVANIMVKPKFVHIYPEFATYLNVAEGHASESSPALWADDGTTTLAPQQDAENVDLYQWIDPFSVPSALGRAIQSLGNSPNAQSQQQQTWSQPQQEQWQPEPQQQQQTWTQTQTQTWQQLQPQTQH
ncbi:hypothetical protein AYO21_10616 [Fonsecaea monophora]|uniref:BZIP domain-containing protein n=1 Tax=Fonsecaea monophora TaxID=254056 RepID=A0A177ETE1_9EURO|nr:hypothetical protein AYO21_10616 [Fonsecaea monophora]KAH0829709.1 hypothetical protein FOPE_10327 [Fonsecaea pedrosoi]OAG35218.1 hypothetical protein AYO21_10616 [Fonsecaea monophora]